MISGIYTITNMVTGGVYVGQSVNIAHRWKCHKLSLSTGKKCNAKLLNSVKKYGIESFDFSIVEVCASDLTIREQEWIDHFKELGCNLFNVRPAEMKKGVRERISVKCPGCSIDFIKREGQKKKFCTLECSNKHKYSDECRAKMSAAKVGKKRDEAFCAKQRLRTMSEDNKAKLIAANKSRERTPEHRDRLIAANTGKKRTPEQCKRISDGRKKANEMKK